MMSLPALSQTLYSIYREVSCLLLSMLPFVAFLLLCLDFDDGVAVVVVNRLANSDSLLSLSLSLSLYVLMCLSV